MRAKHLVFSDSCGERVYLRMTRVGRGGVKYGLARDPADATAFSDRTKAGHVCREGDIDHHASFRAYGVGSKRRVERISPIPA
jgi:hypothetical protein